MAIRTYRTSRANHGLPGTELLRARRRSFRSQDSDCGTGSFVLQNDDPQWSSIAYGDIVKFHLDDSPPRFAMLVEKRTKTTLGQGEEAVQATEFSGRGTLAVLEEGVVFPEWPVGDSTVMPGSDTRTFNFSSRYFDDTPWDLAVENSSDDYGVPQDWPDVTDGVWIADRDVTASTVPTGKMWGRKTFNNATARRVQLHAAGDDLYQVWVNNQEVLTEDRWYAGQSKNVQLDLDVGDVTIAFQLENVNGPSRAGMKIAVYSLGATNEPETLLWETDGTWKVLGFGEDTPGFTPGGILQQLLFEMGSSGFIGPDLALTDVTLGFDHLNDSAGEPWPTVTDFAVRFGMHYLDVARQLAATYCDIAMRPDSLILDAWDKGTQWIAASNVPFQQGVNIVSLDHEGAM